MSSGTIWQGHGLPQDPVPGISLQLHGPPILHADEVALFGRVFCFGEVTSFVSKLLHYGTWAAPGPGAGIPHQLHSNLIIRKWCLCAAGGVIFSVPQLDTVPTVISLKPCTLTLQQP